ncbi:hypothetical protein LCGC14_1279900 [marine sediment metagenome]|uniref:Uncharacterized protein n=1 Tax=marine sediment metagenome TaxID=412755 RepID=A0A0F9KVJ1_9ZZZZ|nr:MAG: hypothetical protein Lokiarch_38790 [Candidatus Lokiarchaeum sp. GC14_75]
MALKDEKKFKSVNWDKMRKLVKDKKKIKFS